MAKSALFALLLISRVAPLWAQGTYTAASCNQSDVNAVVNGPIHTVVDGDIINIPSGTCTWTSALSVSVGISIIGNGSSSTIIQDGLNGTLFIVSIPSATSSTFRLSGMAVTPVSGAGGNAALAWITGTCNANTCSHIRMDNLSITGWTNSYARNYLMYVNNVFGVIDHNTISYVGVIFTEIGHSSYLGVGYYGDNSWAQPDSFGTDKALYIESNTITTTGTNGDAITDTDNGGGRFVARFNNITNASFQTHGTESPGRNRGGRQFEVYSNSLTINTGARADLLGMRSGTGLVFNNVKSGAGQFNHAAALTEYRDNNDFSPWGFCDGQGPYDQNDGITYESGTVASTSFPKPGISVTDTSKSWTANQWVANPPYSVVDIFRTDSNGVNLGAQITSSTSNNVSSSNYNTWGVSHGINIPFVVADSYQILRASACIDQAGHGGAGATLLSGATPSPTGWVNEPLDPVYEWGDTITGGGTPRYGWVGDNATTTRFAANKDYYQQVSPFTGASGTGTGTLASRPSTCTTGVGYWATDVGNWNQSGSGQGQFYVCTATNTWSLYYTPYTYPHPLTGISAPAVVNAASYSPPISPGGFITVFGQNLTDVSADWNSAFMNGNLPTSLGGFQMLIDGKNAYIVGVQPSQVNAIAPPDTATGQVEVDLITPHGTVVTTTTMAATSPALFTYSLLGTVYADAQFATDYAVVAPSGALTETTSRPANSGDYILLYATGLGQTNPPYPVGKALSTAYPVPDLSQVSVTIGGQPAVVTFAGLTYPGVFQINVQVPAGVPAGNQPIELQLGNQTSQPGVYLTFSGN